MSTMKGLVVTDFGKPKDVIQLSSDLSKPTITEDSDEILVEVYYASIHMGDWKVSNGDLGGMAGLMGFKPPFHPGQDYSGKIIQIGKKVQNFNVGDMVFGEVRLGNGTAVQYIVVTEAEKEIYKIPEAINFQEAAAMQCSFETAQQGLTEYGGGLKKQESILILGGTTVIGMHAIQIAKNCFDAKNITVTSSREELCKSLGADTVINYKQKEWEQELKDANFDVIFDVMGGSKSWNDCRSNNVLKQKGKYITVCGDFEADEQVTCCSTCGIMCGVLNRKFWSAMGEQEYHMVNQVRSKTMDECIKMVSDGKVKIMIDEDAPYKLDDYVVLYEKSMGRKAHGKMLLKLYDDGDTQINQEEVDEEPQNGDGNDEEQKYGTY